MLLNDYQKKCMETAVYPIFGADFVYPALGLAGEAGEVVEAVKKLIRDKNSVIDDEIVKRIEGELGDVLWYVAVLAHCFGLDMQTIANTNVQKIQRRLAKGTIHGDGDHR